jgi:acetyl-CoA carboxylase carboxyltransferase component
MNEIAVMGPEAAAGVLNRREMSAVDARRSSGTGWWPRTKSGSCPLYASERRLVDDVIDPSSTRAVTVRALDMLSEKPPEMAPRKHGNPPA